MPNKSDRRKLRGFRKTSKETKMVVRKKKHAKLVCAMCESPLHGVPHGENTAQRNKQSKTQRRPTGAFGGILCGSCRSIVFTETAKVKSGIKTIHEIDMGIRPYLAQIEKRAN